MYLDGFTIHINGLGCLTPADHSPRHPTKILCSLSPSPRLLWAGFEQRTPMRQMLFLASTVIVACRADPRTAASNWTEAQRSQYLSLASSCFQVAYREVGAKDPDGTCRCALPAAERWFQSYGTWRVALDDTRDAERYPHAR